jgi:hypothetical protein
MTSRIALFTVLASALVSVRAAQAQGPVNVVVTLRGDVGQYAGMCGSRTGEDKLTGGLQLVSFDKEDNTALYQGTLERKTSVDACGTQPDPTPDQVKWCFAHLDGSARMNVTLEIHEDNRGARLKSEPVPAPAGLITKHISGCPEPGEWLDTYPNDEIMSGLSFENVPSGYLQEGTYGTQDLELIVY